MRRRPANLALVALAYLVAGVVVTVLVAAACALWSPLNERHHRQHDELPRFALTWTPKEWIDSQSDRSKPDQESWCTIDVKERRGPGVSFVQVEARFDTRRGPANAFNGKRVVIERAGWPWRCMEASCEPESSPWWASRAPPTPAVFRSRLQLPWPRDTILKGPVTRYPGINLQNVTRNFIPLSPVWHAMILNSLVWAGILAMLVHVPRRVRSAIRLRRGLCPRCAYPVGVSGCCTECGCVLPRAAIGLLMPEGAAAASGESSKAANEQSSRFEDTSKAVWRGGAA